jgi:hypothetical protein
MSQTVVKINTDRFPTPSARHATCAWCRAEFVNIVDLIDHVNHGHLADSRMAG